MRLWQAISGPPDGTNVQFKFVSKHFNNIFGIIHAMNHRKGDGDDQADLYHIATGAGHRAECTESRERF
jgi:hypothetical protein